MIVFKRLKPLLVLGMLATVVGCKLQVISPIGGTVTWGDDGECLSGSVCEIAVTNANFTETFIATASVGYEFVGWESTGRRADAPLEPFPFPCGTSPAAVDACIVSLPADPDITNAFIINTLSQGYLMPVYKLLGVDTDGDGVFDGDDAYPNISLNGLLDTDIDGAPNECDQGCQDAGMSADGDDDGDGVVDTDDSFPVDPAETSDTDSDGTGDNADDFPSDPNETSDADDDGVGDNADQCPDTLAGEPIDDAGCPANNGAEVGDGIPASAMSSTTRFDKVIWVPAGGTILAQPFTTIDSVTSYGEFIYHIVAGNVYNPPLNFWVSISPGGQAIDSDCYISRGRDASKLVWSLFATSYCVLDPSTSYYLNVQNDDAGPRSRIDRWVRVLRL